MPITNAHLNWFKLKCPYPANSKAYASAKARLNNASYPDLERLRAEFDEYQDGSIPVTHYNLYDEWFASVNGVNAHAINIKSIHACVARSWMRLRGLSIRFWRQISWFQRSSGIRQSASSSGFAMIITLLAVSRS